MVKILRPRFGALIAAALFLSAPATAQDTDSDGVPNGSDRFPCDPAFASQAFAPAEGVFGTLMFEDLWPGPNDHDVNDLVLNYNHQYYLDAQGRVVRMTATLAPRALGAKEDNGLGLHLPIPASAVSRVTRSVSGGPAQVLTPSTMDTEFTVVVSSNLRELFGNAAGPINALPTLPRVVGQRIVVDIELSTPQPLFASDTPHDLFLFRTTNPGHEFHLQRYPGTAALDTTLFNTGLDESSGPDHWFVDVRRLPSAIDVPDLIEYPTEGADIAHLFGDITLWATNSGTIFQDFYVSDVRTQYAYRDVNGLAAPTSGPPPAATVDISCLASDVVTQTDVTIDASNVADIQGSNWSVPSGVTVTIAYDGPIQVYSLDVAGTIQPAGCTTSACKTLNIDVVTFANIQSSGRLNADGEGYLGSRQSGNGAIARTRGNVPASASYRTGGSHGGRGGQYAATVTPAYDSVYHPALPGSGGTGHNSTNSNYFGGNGGGAIKLAVGGRLTLDGSITANGGRGGSYDTGGAGGSVWIDASEIAISQPGARVQANGSYGYYAGGGGGRVAVYGAPIGWSVDALTVQVNGGTAATGGSYYGGPGTVVHGFDGAAQANLLVYAAAANNNSNAGDTRVGAFGSVTGLTASVLTTNTVLEPGTLVGKTLVADAEGTQTFTIADNGTTTITVMSGDLTGATATGRTFYVADYETDFANVTVSGAARLDAGYMNVANAASFGSSAQVDLYKIDAGQLDVANSALLTIYDINTPSLTTDNSAIIVARNLTFTTATLSGSSQITAWSPTASRIYPVTLTGQNLDVGPSARVHVDRAGYLGSRNSGNGAIGQTLGHASAGASYQTAGSHGGYGGRYGATVTGLYGDVFQPTTAGSGGTGYNNTSANYVGGNGGGALRVDLSGALSLDGLLSADGGRGGSYDAGGAGGSVWVTAASIARTTGGIGIRANGSYGYYSGAGGGRIAIEHGGLSGWSIDPTTVQAHGGSAATGSTYYGGPGTILHRGPGQTTGHLLIHSPTNYRSRFSDTRIGAFGNVTGISGSVLTTSSPLEANTLAGRTLRPDVEQAATFTIVSNTVNTITVQGDLTGAAANGSTFSVLDDEATFDMVTLAGDTHLDVGNLTVTGTLHIQDTSTLDMSDCAISTLSLANSAQLYGRTVTAQQTTLQDSSRMTLWTIDSTSLALAGSTLLTGWDPTTSRVYPVHVIADTLDLGPSARIHVDGLGYLGSRRSGNGAIAQTLGHASAGASYRTGGSHGGYGANYAATVTDVFGDLYQPTTAGSGGTGHNSTDANYAGGIGGGVLEFDIAQQLTLDGVISADATRGGSYDAGAAGGSVWIKAGSIAHNGSGGVRVRANGSYGYYAGGGGGRVALYYGALSGLSIDATTVQAHGGTSATGSTYYGGSGTIMYWPTVDARGSLLIEAATNVNSRYRRTPLGAFGTVSGVSGAVLTSNRAMVPGTLVGATLVPDADNETNTFTIVDNTATTITVSQSLGSATANGKAFYVADYATQFESITIQGDAEVEAGYLDVANQFIVENTGDLLITNLDAANYRQIDAGRLRIERLGFGAAQLSNSAYVEAQLLNGTTLGLANSAKITGWAPSTSVVYPIEIYVTDLDLGSSAQITGNGLGYLGSRQSGNGAQGRTLGNLTAGASYQTGGSHGGLGGRYGATPTPVYGSSSQPFTAGAGGTGYNNSGSNYWAGNGGTAIRIDATGIFNHLGSITAHGGRGGPYDTGGAGGSIWVSAHTLDGTGTFKADGSYGYYSGGGGGRVAVYATQGSWTQTSSNLTSAGGGTATGATYHGSAGSAQFILQ